MKSEEKSSLFFLAYYLLLITSYTIPCAIMALATFMKPATLAPFT